MARKKRDWMFYMENGQKQDAGLHSDLLDGVDDYPLRVQSAQAAVNQGVELSLALEVYRLRSEDITGGN